MKEIYDNIYTETVTYEDRHRSPRNLYIIRQPGRSLMIDTSFRFERDLHILEQMVESLGIDYRNLDIFITHDHPDHSGLVPDLLKRGARAYMNPEETRKRADLLHCYLANEKERIDNFRTVGVTPEHTPEVFATMMEYTGRAYRQRRELPEFPFIPVSPGHVFSCGDYRFEVVSLKGHTFGQCGLYEKTHKLLFCGDQIMTTIVPIVGSQQKDLGLLKCYLESLESMKNRYGDCRFLPCHYGPVEDLEGEVSRIVVGYMEKCTIMKRVLEEHDGPLTTRDVGVRAYGRSDGPPDYDHFVSCTQIWAKTFSCLEYLYGEGFINRWEKDGVLYWESIN